MDPGVYSEWDNVKDTVLKFGAGRPPGSRVSFSEAG